MAIPPAGRRVILPMAILGERHRGRIRRDPLYHDAGFLLRQLGPGDHTPSRIGVSLSGRAEPANAAAGRSAPDLY